MANQPPTARPFIRLPYFGRQPTQLPPQRPTTVVQPPRPPIVRAGFAQALRPNAPLLRPTAPPPLPTTPPQLRSASPSPPPPPTLKMTSPVLSSPSPMASPNPSPMASPIFKPSPSPNLKSPMASPKPSPSPTLKSPIRASPMPSPTLKSPIALRSVESSPSPMMGTRSPSPISLPPSQLQSSKGEVEYRTLAEAEQKTVDKQMVYPTPKGSPLKGFNNDHNRHNLLSDSKEGRVVTMAGENRGAVMELGHDGNFSDNVNSDSDEDEFSKRRKGRVPRNAYVNSNVQGVNESILYNCSISHHDPGVHFSLSRNGYSKGNGYGIKYHSSGRRL